MKKLITMAIICILLVGCDKVSTEELSHIEMETSELATTPEVYTDNTLDYTILSNGKVTEIDHGETFNMTDAKYIVLYTHEQCDFCMDLWLDHIMPYLSTEDALPMYVVDMKSPLNTRAWQDIKEIPLIYVVEDGILNQKATGLDEGSQLIKEW